MESLDPYTPPENTPRKATVSTVAADHINSPLVILGILVSAVAMVLMFGLLATASRSSGSIDPAALLAGLLTAACGPACLVGAFTRPTIRVTIPAAPAASADSADRQRFVRELTVKSAAVRETAYAVRGITPQLDAGQVVAHFITVVDPASGKQFSTSIPAGGLTFIAGLEQNGNDTPFVTFPEAEYSLEPDGTVTRRPGNCAVVLAAKNLWDLPDWAPPAAGRVEVL